MLTYGDATLRVGHPILSIRSLLYPEMFWIHWGKEGERGTRPSMAHRGSEARGSNLLLFVKRKA